MEEIWKDIKGYEGIYQVSNLGNVKSLKINKNMGFSKLPKGYLKVGLCKNGIRKYFFIHRLVAKAFISNPNNLSCVNHKDCNTSNNNANNLEWCSYQENNSYKNHHLKRSITLVLYYLKKDYSKQKEIIKKAEELQKIIYNF